MRAYRNLTLSDRFLDAVDDALRTLVPGTTQAGRPYPANTPEAPLKASEREAAGAMMRINHCGEVCAQALYRGQAATARDPRLVEKLREAAGEEADHLAWCERRLQELGSSPSAANPLFYAGSFLIAATAGALGDRWNLGFLEETERQVVEHLESHMQELPTADARSREVLAVMRSDEARHAEDASEAGAARLPGMVKLLMRAQAEVMKQVTGRV